jgi:hypothetical protein
MLQIIKLHIGLYRYLKTELPKQKSPKAVILFLWNVTVMYFKELFKMIKNISLLFDKTYQQQQKQHKKMQQLKVDLNRALKVLQYVETKMKQQGIPRWKVRQFFRDFYNNGQVRKEVFDDLLKEIDQIK